MSVFSGVLIFVITVHSFSVCANEGCEDIKNENKKLVELVKRQKEIIAMFEKRFDQSESDDEAKPDENSRTKVDLKIIGRNEWLAQIPQNELTDLKLPVEKVIITHTASELCMTQVNFTLICIISAFLTTEKLHLGCMYS